MTAIANLVQQKTISTGAGALLLSGINGNRSFASAFGTGGSDMFFYFIRHRSAPEWEVGTGHMADAATLVRDHVISSSNGGAKVAFSAGEKDVVNDVAAERQMVLPAAPTLGDMLVFDGLRWQAAKPAMTSVGGLEAALAGKADNVHGHTIGDVTGLSGALGAKAASVHSHTPTDITGLGALLDSKAAAYHAHGIDGVTGLQEALDTKAAAAHSHSTGDISDIDELMATRAAAEHTHAVADIEGLATALAAKAASVHGHVISDVSGLGTLLDGKAAAGHAHAIGDITSLQTTLDAKAPATREVATSGSLTGGGNLSANRSLSLSGDETSPGAGKYYGTDGTGNKGFHTLPAAALPDAADVAFDDDTQLITTGADVQAALQNTDTALQRAGFHPCRTVSFNHFTGSDSGPFIAAASGTSANAATIESDYAVNTDALGVYRLTTGTTATGAAWRSLGTAGVMLHAPGKVLRLKSRIRLANLTASGSQEFRAWGGITMNTAANTNPALVIGMYWYYDKDNTHWVLRRRNAGFVYDAVTDVTVEAGVWYDMELVVHGAADDGDVTCELFINGVAKAFNSQLVGRTGYNVVSAALQKVVGTTARLMYIDYEALFMERGT